MQPGLQRLLLVQLKLQKQQQQQQEQQQQLGGLLHRT
jgi:hypothetical protein